MKMRILLLTGLTLTMSSDVVAQGASQNSNPLGSAAVDNVGQSASVGCDYNTCALRMKLSWGNWLIIRGAQEQRVAKLGIFRAPVVESIVASSPDAVSEARLFRKNYTPGEVLQAVGVVMMVMGLASSSGNDSAVIPVTGVLGGGVALLYGVHLHVRAFNALHKTIWLYNRSLQR